MRRDLNQTLRVGNVAGADSLLVNTGKCNVQKPLLLDQFADGTSPQRSYIGPQTLARVLVSLCQSGNRLPDILNIATPTPVFMADLLDATKCNWHFQPAPPNAIKSVCLDTTALGKFHDFTAQDSAPVEIIRQWRTCEAMQ